MNRYAPVKTPRVVFQGLEAVRRSGRTNMLAREAVVLIALKLRYCETASWIENYEKFYAKGIFYGFAVDINEEKQIQVKAPTQVKGLKK